MRYAVRSMAKDASFTAAAVLSIALGIGANTAIFSLMDAVLLRAMPVRDPQQLYFLGHDPGERVSTSANYPMFERYHGMDVFSGVTVYSTNAQGFRVVTADGSKRSMDSSSAAIITACSACPSCSGAVSPQNRTGPVHRT